MVNGSKAQIEYNIYTFDMPGNGKKGETQWKLNSTTSDMVEAMNKAESLHETKKFHKIEVKKKFFDEKKKRIIDMPLKAFETKPPSNMGLYLIVLGSIILGVAAFALTYYLTHDPVRAEEKTEE